jgi:hypothetical protein
LHGSALVGYRPDFDRQTIFQCWTLFGDFQRFIKIVQYQEEIAADGLLGLGERTIRDRPSLPGNYLSLTFERLGAFDLPLQG